MTRRTAAGHVVPDEPRVHATRSELVAARPIHEITFSIDGQLLPSGLVWCWRCLRLLNREDWAAPCVAAPLAIEVAD